jgi:uncharacterized protein (DUF305 family)
MKGFVIAGVALAIAAGALGAVAQERAQAAPPGVTALMKAHDAMMARMRGPGVAYSGDPDLDFVTQMIPHHQGAIDMAKVLLQHGTSFDTRKFAERIITAQESEIAQMTRWKEGHATAPAASADAAASRAAFEAANRKMMAAMGGDHAHGGDKPEQAFLTMMLPHHQGAIDMAAVAVRYGKDPEMRALAQKMMTEQVGEMIEMMELLGELGHH